MATVNDAIERLKIMECPTGAVEDKITNILERYGLGNHQEIRVNRDEKLDRNGAYAYTAKVPELGNQSIVVLAESGKDDYVAKVVEVYIS
jgi:hypothetical protein